MRAVRTQFGGPQMEQALPLPNMCKLSSFLEVKEQLQQLGLSYTLFYHAKVRVVTNDLADLFKASGEVWRWLEQESVAVKGAGTWQLSGQRRRRDDDRKFPLRQVTPHLCRQEQRRAERARLVEAVVTVHQSQDSATPTSPGLSCAVSDSEPDSVLDPFGTGPAVTKLLLMVLLAMA
ncbi:hypothetical protein NDU88_002126 [Pleurodeles waltl]|uniref:Uncharacterized protein n=1 Tax=Pleurodeles waltl TaxID=8319 RepID=A0AAV7SBL2_PLEWA|nr:hypothetical protein NDU88_002126 [Pleurodeles waltl]